MIHKVRWRVIPEFEKYSISELGEIRNNETGYILHPVLRSDGRLQVCLSNEKGRRFFYIHKLVYDIFKKDSKGLYVMHMDGNKLNNRVDNLVASDTPHGGKRKARPRQSRRVKDLTTGHIYKSLKSCVLAIGGSSQGLWSCLNGYTKTYKGHIFKYFD